jgi:hypothetical protein
MIHYACCMACMLVFLMVEGSLAGETEARERQRFDPGWRFLHGDDPGERVKTEEKEILCAP